MTLLLDPNLSRRLKTPLLTLFEEVLHFGEMDMDETPDEDLWRFAKDRGWTIMSKDGDLADMALSLGRRRKSSVLGLATVLGERRPMWF